MDASDASADEGVMIAFLPVEAEWSTLELPHMTLVYAGTKGKLGPSDLTALVKDTASIAMLAQPFSLQVMRKEVFGTDEKVDVLLFRPTEQLIALRSFVEKWNASEHSFSPHATIGPQGTFVEYIPKYVHFNRVTVGWGKEYTTFKL